MRQMQVLVALLCSGKRVCSCSLLFKAPHLIPCFIIIFFSILLIIIYSVSFPPFFQFSVMGVGVGAGSGFFWRVVFLAGLQVGRALGCSGCLDLG